MQNILSHYMRERMEKSASKGSQKEPGPVVTISRAYGCPGKLVGQELVHALNKKLAATHVKDHWRWISKEILEESAKELKLDKFIIKEAAHSHQKGIMTSLIQSLSNKFYPGDDKVKKTIADVIRTFSKEGKVVIVGRGGVSLTQDIKNSFHIKLEAPMEWRIQKVCEMYQLTPDEATKRILEIDYKRNKLREYYEVKKPDPWVFDMIFHLNRMSVEEIVETSVGIIEARKFI
jgi:cytidylate kinase